MQTRDLEILKNKHNQESGQMGVGLGWPSYARVTDSASFPILSTSCGESFFAGFRSFLARCSNPSAYDTSSELHPALRRTSENRSVFRSRASRTAWLSTNNIAPSKNPEAETCTISEMSVSLQPPSLKVDPISSMYSFTHFGIPDLGISKNTLSGEEDVDEDEFLRRRSTTASLQNSTHLGVLAPVSRLRRKKLDEEAADFSLMDLCLLRRWVSDSELRNRNSRSKKSDRSKPQKEIRFSSTENIGFPAREGLQGM